jgi:MoxR-like ATPase
MFCDRNDVRQKRGRLLERRIQAGGVQVATEIDSERAARQGLDGFSQQIRTIRNGLHQVVIGQDAVVDQVLSCAITDSHALIVGVPGLAKTLIVKALAAAFHWKFARIQFTPDLMPADITGYELLSRDDSQGAPRMAFRPGPVFANLVLADEINRATPKTQSALLEAMAELQVTVGGTTYPLEEPFLVVATQNPIEQEGTYPLPEAQLDRFMMEIHISYPTPAQEEEIVMKTSGEAPAMPRAALDRDAFLQLRKLVRSVPIPTTVAAYAVKLCGASRPEDSRSPKFIKDYVAWGAGPRGSQNLVRAAKARALLDGRAAPTIADVRAVALPVLRHRVLANHRAVGDAIGADELITRLLDAVVN